MNRQGRPPGPSGDVRLAVLENLMGAPLIASMPRLRRAHVLDMACLLLLLFLGVLPARGAGPDPVALKKLRLAHVDPPIAAPEFRLLDLNRREVSLRELKGKGVLLYFWASW